MGSTLGYLEGKGYKIQRGAPNRIGSIGMIRVPSLNLEMFDVNEDAL